MQRYGLLGQTLKHSFSQKFFTEKFREWGIQDAVYENFELPDIRQFPRLLEQHPDLKGMNVTIPYKEEVVQFLDEKNEIVEKTGACNCIRFRHGKLQGFNTDVLAFKATLEQHLKPHQCSALVLGSGGASKAVVYALQLLEIDYAVVSRRKASNQLGYEELGNDAFDEYKIIVNTTPLGMYPNVNESPSIPYEYLGSQHILYDLTYNPPITEFLRKGQEKGATIVNGYAMLEMQAMESWKIWSE